MKKLDSKVLAAPVMTVAAWHYWFLWVYDLATDLAKPAEKHQLFLAVGIAEMWCKNFITLGWLLGWVIIRWFIHCRDFVRVWAVTLFQSHLWLGNWAALLHSYAVKRSLRA